MAIYILCLLEHGCEIQTCNILVLKLIQMLSQGSVDFRWLFVVTPCLGEMLIFDDTIFQKCGYFFDTLKCGVWFLVMIS